MIVILALAITMATAFFTTAVVLLVGIIRQSKWDARRQRRAGQRKALAERKQPRLYSMNFTGPRTRRQETDRGQACPSRVGARPPRPSTRCVRTILESCSTWPSTRVHTVRSCLDRASHRRRPIPAAKTTSGAFDFWPAMASRGSRSGRRSTSRTRHLDGRLPL